MSDLTRIISAPDTVRLSNRTPVTPAEVEAERIRLLREQERHFKRLCRQIVSQARADGVAQRKNERKRRALANSHAREQRRIKKQLSAERLSGATSLAAATRALLGDRPETSTGGQIRTKDGKTSFHFDLTTVSKTADGKHSAVAHLHYISRAQAVARLEITTDPQAIEAARLMRYAARDGAVAQGQVSLGTNPLEPEERERGAMLFGSIGRTRLEQEAYWHAVAKSERTPTRARFLFDPPITDATKIAEIAKRYEHSKAYSEWDPEAKAFALVLPDNLDKRSLPVLKKQLKDDLRARFIQPRGGRVQYRLIMGLPHELAPESMLNMCDEFTEILRESGLPYFGAIHKPDGDNNPLNWHVHLAFHDRPAKIIQTDKGSMWDFEYSIRNPKTRWVSHPYAQNKARWVNDKGTPARLRKIWCDLANKHLAAAAASKRWFAESYQTVGIKAEALKRLPQKAYAMEMRGIQTSAGRERIRQEQAQSVERREALRVARVPDAKIIEQEQIVLKSTDPSARLLLRRAALKREIARREALQKSNSARDVKKLRARLARDKEALKIVNAMLIELDGEAAPGGKATIGPFQNLSVQEEFAPNDGLFATWNKKRVAFAPTATDMIGRGHVFHDHPEGYIEKNGRHVAENVAGRELARLHKRFTTDPDEMLKETFAKMSAKAKALPAGPPELVMDAGRHEAMRRLEIEGEARRIEMLSQITGISASKLQTPEMQRAAIIEHVRTLYKAERASAALARENLSIGVFENDISGGTAPQAPPATTTQTVASMPSVASIPSVPTLASTPSMESIASVPTIASQTTVPTQPTVPSQASVASTPTVAAALAPQGPVPQPRPIPTFEQFRQRVFQDWTNAVLSFKTNPDREKQLDRFFVADTLERAKKIAENPESYMALTGAEESNKLDSRRLQGQDKRAFYEAAIFEAARRAPDQEVRMQRLALVGEIVDRAKKIETENGVVYRVQKDLAFALAEPLYAPYVGDEVTRYAQGESAEHAFSTAPQRDYRVTEAEARAYDARQRDVYVEIPARVFAERLDKLRNTVIELPTNSRAGADFFSEANKRFNAFIQSRDVSMLSESPGFTPGVIPVGPPGEERAINAMRARQGLTKIEIPNTVVDETKKAFLAPDKDGKTLEQPDDLLSWTMRKFNADRSAGILQTSAQAREKAFGPTSRFTKSLAPLDMANAYKAAGVRTLGAKPTAQTAPSQSAAPRMNPIKSQGPTR